MTTIKATLRLTPAHLFLACTAVLAASGAYATPEFLPPGMRVCQQMKDDAERLACYDRELAAHTVAPEKTFGLNAEKTRETQKIKTAVEAPSVAAKVTAITHRPHGELVYTLDNGQVWAQLLAAESRIEVGNTVSVKPGAMGSFFLYSPSGLATRVKRVQ
jgi:hypothetical protein